MSQPNELIEIVVKAGGNVGADCDFTDIKTALDSITDNSAEKPYRLRIQNGVYDVSYDGNLYLGMKNYVDIVGQSRGGVQVIKREADYSDAKSTFDSAFYKQKIEYSSLRNMTIISKNTKCPVHIDDDYLSGTIELIDCTLINENTPDMGNYQNGLACGLRKGQRVVARGVYSNGMLWAHNGVELYGDEGCRFELFQCICKFIMIGDLATYGKDIVIVEGCKAEFLRYLYFKNLDKEHLRGYKQSSFTFELRGNQIEYIEAVVTLDGGHTFIPTGFDEVYEGKWSICDPAIHQFVKNTSSMKIVKGSPVSRDAETDMNGVKNWCDGDLLYGVALDSIQAGEFGIVQYSGIVQLSIISDKGILLNDALELDASGNAIKQSRGAKIGYARGKSNYGGDLLKVKLLMGN
ncbi:DUF2190 family protein [Paenibacillus eucommiae]|uniref:Pectate lyase superfamily protein domain-containing protein n=1 Tax=Paenibacillus eucommiae TaxID=1355755 RepID=A0ABS4ITN7_9BACL|nr:DUF2190 family protein [Paenibacillus eucommiae]MBP1990934.1 hypothetical protein [Paenibacillus eucommiae]